jgi:hypothetical protein
MRVSANGAISNGRSRSMDRTERERYKRLANESIIETFGTECPEQRLAEALERCVDELEDANSKCPTCSVCENHGDYEVNMDYLTCVEGE